MASPPADLVGIARHALSSIHLKRTLSAGSLRPCGMHLCREEDATQHMPPSDWSEQGVITSAAFGSSPSEQHAVLIRWRQRAPEVEPDVLDVGVLV